MTDPTFIAYVLTANEPPYPKGWHSVYAVHRATGMYRLPALGVLTWGVLITTVGGAFICQHGAQIVVTRDISEFNIDPSRIIHINEEVVMT